MDINKTVTVFTNNIVTNDISINDFFNLSDFRLFLIRCQLDENIEIFDILFDKEQYT